MPPYSNRFVRALEGFEFANSEGEGRWSCRLQICALVAAEADIIYIIDGMETKEDAGQPEDRKPKALDAKSPEYGYVESKDTGRKQRPKMR
jgi:hypothetical protein